MKASELRTKSITELNDQLKELVTEQFKLKMQHGNGALGQTNKLKQVRRDIARTRTVLTELQNNIGGAA